MLPEYKGQGRASRCRIDNFVKGWSGTVNFDFPGYSQGATANGNGVAAPDQWPTAADRVP